MAMTALHDAAKHSKIMKFILGGFIFLAVGGLVFMDVGGYFRGGLNTTTVAVVGDHKIDIREFDNTLRGVLIQANLTPKQAYDLGIVNAVLEAQIDDVLKAQSAAELNLNINNATVAAQLQKMIAPQVPAGTDIKEHIQMILRSQGISEHQIASSIRVQMQTAITDKLPSGIVNYTPSFALDAYSKIQAEKRSGQIITLSADKLVTDDIDVTDQEIENFYDNNIEDFAIPGERVIAIGQLTTDMVKSAVRQYSDNDLRAVYEERIDDFAVPAKRLIAQAVLRDEAQAKAVYEAATEGQSLENAVQAVTGSKQAYRKSAAYADGDLPNELSAAAFDDSVTEGTVIEPIKTALGWHIMEVQGFSDATQLEFDQVKSQLREEVETSALYDLLYEKLTIAENMMDAGQNFATIAEELGLKVTKTKSVARNAQAEDLPKIMQTVMADTPEIIDEIFELGEGESLYPIETEDEGFVIFAAESIKLQQYRDLADVRDTIIKEIKSARRDQLARAEIDKIVASLNNGETTLDEVVRTYNGKKQDFVLVDRNTESHDSATIFATAQSAFNPYITGDDSYGIVTVNSIIRDTSDQNAQTVANNLKSLYRTGISAADRHFMRSNTKIRINEDLLRQQYAGIVME